MRDLRPTVLALLILVVVAGCSDDGPVSTGTADESTPSSTPAEEGAAIPDGSYAKTATVAEAKAMGITDKGFLRELGEDGETSYVYKFEGDRWTEFVVEEAPEPGDGGTLAYDDQGDIVLTSASDGCPGCEYTYDWAMDGDELTMTIVGHDSTDTPEDVLLDRFVTEGAFTRQS